MRDMKVSPSGQSGAVPQADLDAAARGETVSPAVNLAEEDEDEDDDDDDGEVIDRSARTDYYELPERRRGTGPGGAIEGDDGTLWPAP